MKTVSPYELPAEKEKKLREAARLEWITLFFLLTITAVMFLTMGTSQAMKTAWIEDVLSLIPPLTFLVAVRYRDRPPTAEYPYGFRRGMLLSFLAASAAVLVLGLYMLYDSLHALLTRHHPSMGHFSMFGQTWDIWSGWVMMGALAYSMIPPVILGRMKLRLAGELHEKTLHADAAMNKADWMTAAAAIAGITGVGLGLWWADAAAAGFISIAVVRDGISNIKRSMGDLMDRAPTDVAHGKPLDLMERLRDEVRKMPGVLDAGVRLREEGNAVSGEVFVMLEGEGAAVAGRLEEIARRASELDWRLNNLVVMPVTKL